MEELTMSVEAADLEIMLSGLHDISAAINNISFWQNMNSIENPREWMIANYELVAGFTQTVQGLTGALGVAIANGDIKFAKA